MWLLTETCNTEWISYCMSSFGYTGLFFFGLVLFTMRISPGLSFKPFFPFVCNWCLSVCFSSSLSLQTLLCLKEWGGWAVRVHNPTWDASLAGCGLSSMFLLSRPRALALEAQVHTRTHFALLWMKRAIESSWRRGWNEDERFVRLCKQISPGMFCFFPHTDHTEKRLNTQRKTPTHSQYIMMKFDQKSLRFLSFCCS